MTRWNGHSMFRVTVAMPADSISRATHPADRQQSGQTGASNARSTSSLFMAAAIAGALPPTSTLLSFPW